MYTPTSTLKSDLIQVLLNTQVPIFWVHLHSLTPEIVKFSFDRLIGAFFLVLENK